MRLASWNVNSIRQREQHVARWLERVRPDILVLQEIKCEAMNFPELSFAAQGYRAEIVGQKAYNGVAVLSRIPAEVTHRALPGLPEIDSQARYIEVRSGGIVVGGLYLPNGNSGGADGFAAKLRWLDRLGDHAAAMLDAETDFVLLGDYNVCPTDADFAPGALAPNDALVHPESRARFRRLLWLGLTDAVRALHPTKPNYSFWDYQSAAWERDSGLRIDHALLSPVLAERLISAVPDRDERGRAQPSDHVPVLIELDDAPA